MQPAQPNESTKYRNYATIYLGLAFLGIFLVRPVSYGLSVDENIATLLLIPLFGLSLHFSYKAKKANPLDKSVARSFNIILFIELFFVALLFI